MAKEKHLRIKKSNFDKVCAAALAGGMVLSVMSPTAFAMTYDGTVGTVYVGESDGSVLSWQDNNETYTESNPYNHTTANDGKGDNEIKIIGNTDSEEDTDARTENSNQIIDIGDGVTGVGGNESLEVNVDGVEVDGTTDAAIKIGDDANVDLNIKDTSITNASNDGIAIGDNSNVDITFEGDNLFTGVGDQANASGVQTSGSGDDGQTTVTITGKGDDATFTVENASNGIYVGRNDSVTIDGGNPDGEGNLDIVIKDTVDTMKSDCTTSGAGILNYGDLMITGGADVKIDNVDIEHPEMGGQPAHGIGIDSDFGSVTIEGVGTDLTIKDTERYGIYVGQGENLVIDQATVTLDHVGGGSAINFEGGANGEIKDGATVMIADPGYNGIQMEGDGAGTLSIHGEGTTVTITESEEGRGYNGINLAQEKTLHIYDEAYVQSTGFGQQLNYYGNTVGNGLILQKNNSTVKIENATLDVSGNADPDKDASIGYSGKNNVIEIGNGARVIADTIENWSGPNSGNSLIVTGGTLELLSTRGNGLNANYSQKLYDEKYENETYMIWPTNGAVYGDEKLVNFQLPADAAHAFFDTFGWKDGQAIPYADGYSCDLSKYQEGETLSVWVPAVVLDYYYKDELPEGTSFENMTEDEVLALLENTVFKGQDAIIRGQSIRFATLNQTYTSNNTADTSKTWYYFDAEGNLQSFNADTKIVAQNLKNIYGLDVIEEEPTPDEPGTDDPATPVTPIVKPEDPKAPVVIEEIPVAPEVPEAPAEEISAEPQVKLPQTGQNWALAGLLAIAGGLMAAIGITPRKHRKDEHEV